MKHYWIREIFENPGPQYNGIDAIFVPGIPSDVVTIVML